MFTAISISSSTAKHFYQHSYIRPLPLPPVTSTRSLFKGLIRVSGPWVSHSSAPGKQLSPSLHTSRHHAEVPPVHPLWGPRLGLQSPPVTVLKSHQCTHSGTKAWPAGGSGYRWCARGRREEPPLTLTNTLQGPGTRPSYCSGAGKRLRRTGSEHNLRVRKGWRTSGEAWLPPCLVSEPLGGPWEAPGAGPSA